VIDPPLSQTISSVPEKNVEGRLTQATQPTET